jgi:hypothetical protein
MGQSLLDSISTRLRFGKDFRKSFDSYGCSADRYLILNEKIDQLARFIEKGVNPNSLNFKKLAGNPVPPSTHEIYAWSDSGAHRLFGRYEDEVFIIEKFGKHLPD